jgi:hypothetical protein
VRRNEFTLPYKQRTCPENTPKEVWGAFAEAVDAKGNNTELWSKFLEIKSRWWDEDRQAYRDKPVCPNQQLNLFVS